MTKAIEEWEKSSEDPKVREEYLDRRKAILDEMAAVREAELRLREAIKASKAEGIVEGEHEKAIQIARNLKEMGIEIEKIAQATGLSTNDIESID